jgi:hypothetical protein
MTKKIFAFHDFANAYKNKTLSLPRPIRQLLWLSHRNSACPATCMVQAATTTV